MPSGLFNISSLSYLLLDANRLNGQLQEFPNNSLQLLNLSNNELSSPIPPLVATNFLISHNKFAEITSAICNVSSSEIPKWGGNKLRNIDLSGNQLEGKVPRSLATCIHLEVLDFGNSINDTFPYWLETLLKLQVLSFQTNKFHGPMGSSKTQLPFPKLRILDLTHIEFSGFLPTTYFKHFKAMRIINESVGLRYIGELIIMIQ
ncbi:hypothetical protein ACSBR1_025838 [Camellia fascicularis]